jgi:homoserine kinase
MRFSVRAPASSANLGPGFDTLAIALSCYLTVEIDLTRPPDLAARPADLAGGDDLVAVGMQAVARELGRTLPACHVCARSDIPVARGLGSSAAAIVAGLSAANCVFDHELTLDDLLQIANRLEGHADNIAAALFGGAVITVTDGDHVSGVPVRICGDLVAVVFVPERIGLTKDARAAVPMSFSREDAVFNTARCALLVHALASGHFSLLSEAMRDAFHQPYRSRLYPHLATMLAGAPAAGAYGASLSGSGPSVLALTDAARAMSVAEFFQSEARKSGTSGSCLVLAIAEPGVEIVSG